MSEPVGTRDKLIKILKSFKAPVAKGLVFRLPGVEKLADHLLAEGVIVPPVKVGQTVYVVYGDKVIQGKVRLIRPFIDKEKTIFKGNIICEVDGFLDGTKEEVELFVVFVIHYGIERVAFLTRAEAEKALAERSENGTN